MGKIIKIKESDFTNIVKKLIKENDQKNETISLLKYLTKKFKGNKISMVEFSKILDQLGMDDIKNPAQVFNIFNKFVSTDVNWVDHISDLEKYDNIILDFINRRFDKKNIVSFEGYHECADFDEGYNSFDMDVEVVIQYFNETYIFTIRTDVSLFYVSDPGDYYHPPSDSIEDVKITCADRIIFYDNDGDSFPFKLEPLALKIKLESLIEDYYSPYDCKIVWK